MNAANSEPRSRGSTTVQTVGSPQLVPLGPEHLPAMRETMRDPAILRFTRTPNPMPDGWLESWLGKFDHERRFAWAIVDDDGRFLGYAVTAGEINREDQEVELGYAVAPDVRERGVATEALRQLTQWAFDQGMLRVVALISTDNPASSRVAEKAGYTLEGVLRSVHHINGRRGDLQSWSMLPDDLPAQP